MMPADATPTDAELLRRYSDERSEAAFAELVRRHLDVVHSAALRQVGGNSAAAADIAQAVFTELARKASRLTRHPALVGWLYTTTHRLAVRQVRDESRRQRREREAHAMHEAHRSPDPEADWNRLAPVLDEAMHELAEADRLALLLRHFEQRPFADVGARLGLGENAARMRVDRALDRLRARLAKRGITSTGSALALALGGPAVVAAPAGLAANIAAGAMAAGAPTASTFGLLSFMASSKLKVGAVILGFGLLGTAFIVQRHDYNELKEENTRLQRSLTKAELDLESLHKDAKQNVAESNRLLDEKDELLRLRGRVAELLRSTYPTNRSATHPAVPNGNDALTTPIDALEDMGTETPEDASVSFIWALSAQQRERFVQLVKLPDDLSPETTVRHLNHLFTRMTNAYSQWEFRSLRRAQTGATGLSALGPKSDEVDRLRGQTRDQATLRMNAAYLDLKSGNEGELLVFLREFDSGWKIVIDDVPREAPSADGP